MRGTSCTAVVEFKAVRSLGVGLRVRNGGLVRISGVVSGSKVDLLRGDLVTEGFSVTGRLLTGGTGMGGISGTKYGRFRCLTDGVGYSKTLSVTEVLLTGKASLVRGRGGCGGSTFFALYRRIFGMHSIRNLTFVRRYFSGMRSCSSYGGVKYDVEVLVGREKASGLGGVVRYAR